MTVVWAFLLCFQITGVKAIGWDVRTALDDYIAQPDSSYTWEEINRYEREECTVLILNMTSQTWMDDVYSSRSVWWHHVTVSVPSTIRYQDAGYLLIGAGDNKEEAPDEDSEMVTLTCDFAQKVGVVTGAVNQIPNQPITFSSDLKERSGDDMIAYQWNQFIVDDEANPEIIPMLPMTKAAVRAMDTITAAAKTVNPETNLNRFMVSGASKRGWIAQLVASVDRRVVVTAPIILTCLNFVKNLHHYYRAFGGWSYALEEYHQNNITAQLDNPRMQVLMDIIDPYAYKERLTMAKLIIYAANDEFFNPDDTHYYFDALPKPKYLMLLENTSHGLGPGDNNDRILNNQAAIYKIYLTETPWPQMSWERNEISGSGSITLTSNETPLNIKSWMTSTDGARRRDFRFRQADGTTNNIQWSEKQVEELGDGKFRVEFDEADEGWRLFFINAKYSAPEETELEITTEAHIIPATFPFPDCSGVNCRGTLV